MSTQPDWGGWQTRLEEQARAVAEADDPQAGLDALDELNALCQEAGEHLIRERDED